MTPFSRVSPERETLRYLGYGKAEPDAQVLALVRDSLEQVRAAANPRTMHRGFTVARDGGFVTIGTLSTHSQALLRHLEGCGSALLFAATLGAPVDALLRRAEAANMASAVVLQAAATAVIEDYCDQVCAELAAELAKERLYLRPRFSPGYGDLPVELQPLLLELLECRRIGLGCTGSCMLTPVKSVTAVIGVGETPVCARGGCSGCAKTDCNFRK